MRLPALFFPTVRFFLELDRIKVAEMPANASFVIPVFTGMTGSHKRLVLIIGIVALKSLPRKDLGNFANDFMQHWV